MLVNKRQEWFVYEEQVAPPVETPSPRLKRRGKLNFLSAIFIAAVMALLVTVQSAAIVQAGYDLVQMKAQLAKLEKENELLRLDIAKLKSPQRIQHIATSQLGMVVPERIYCSANTTNTAEKAQGTTGSTVAAEIRNFFTVGRAEASKGR